ncbi:PAS domain-containing protein [Devosia aurantiaca]|uniref:PAS domain-containing protein n=1 Tax=Devosia aurantiaca TaxID=2714858 RepID=A0A6M1SRT9_9HYPH|nr:PAS domain-containing protein [Devosia aurantiaca]
MYRLAKWTSNRNLFKSLVEGPGLLGWICDSDGLCVYLSPGWYAYTGAESAEGLNWLNYIHPDDRIPTRRALHAAVDGRVEYLSDFRLRRADGKYIVSRGHGTPISMRI